MNTTVATDEIAEQEQKKPGAYLALVRQQKGYTAEYVAGKLHLRVRIIELLEADDYDHMSEPVFIKGYLRAYAKLLGADPEPLLDVFNEIYAPVRKAERALWQSRREVNKAEHAIRWLTGVFAVAVLVAVSLWWYTNRENEQLLPATVSRADSSPTKSDAEIRLTDLSKMRSLLSTPSQQNTLEKEGG